MSQDASIVCTVNIDCVFGFGMLGLFAIFLIAIIDPISRETIIRRLTFEDPFDIYKNSHNLRYWVAIFLCLALLAIFVFFRDGCH